MKNVLILCTGNSCRSIMAEGLLKHYGKGKFRAFSAGSIPAGTVHPLSLATLERHGMSPLGYESKSWDVFTDIAMDIDIVITVCDNAAGETCPIFPGNPVKAHWGAPDPAHFPGTPAEVEAEFDRVFAILERRIKVLVTLQMEGAEKEYLRALLMEIGRIE